MIKMVLIKYYSLESRSWEVVSDLERNLQKHLLDAKNVKGLLEAPIEAIADVVNGNGDSKTLNRLMYDSGEFDVLYKKSDEISSRKKGTRRWFRANDPDIPERVGVELVVRANEYDVIGLQNYLSESSFEVMEARSVSQATCIFTTDPSHDKATKNYKKILEKYIKFQHRGVKHILRTEDDVTLDSNFGSTCGGMLYGSVLEVLKLRSILIKGGYGVGLFEESVTFS